MAVTFFRWSPLIAAHAGIIVDFKNGKPHRDDLWAFDNPP